MTCNCKIQQLLCACVELREVDDQLKYADAMAHKDICLAVAFRAAPERRGVLAVIYDEVILLLTLLGKSMPPHC